jgi:tetratricopeptide (TPR) repeat protein
MRRAAILCLVLTWIAPMAWGDEVKPSHKALGETQEALAEFDRVIAADPEIWQALYNKIAVLGIDLDRKSEAKALLPTLLKLQPNNALVQELAASLEKK